jgi:hypothetical protein
MLCVPQTLFAEMISEQKIALDRIYVSMYTVHNFWPILFKIVMYELIILKLLEVVSNLTVPYIFTLWRAAKYTRLYAPLRSREKRVLAVSCLSLRQHALFLLDGFPLTHILLTWRI